MRQSAVILAGVAVLFLGGFYAYRWSAERQQAQRAPLALHRTVAIDDRFEIEAWERRVTKFEDGKTRRQKEKTVIAGHGQVLSVKGGDATHIRYSLHKLTHDDHGWCAPLTVDARAGRPLEITDGKCSADVLEGVESLLYLPEAGGVTDDDLVKVTEPIGAGRSWPADETLLLASLRAEARDIHFKRASGKLTFMELAPCGRTSCRLVKWKLASTLDMRPALSADGDCEITSLVRQPEDRRLRSSVISAEHHCKVGGVLDKGKGFSVDVYRFVKQVFDGEPISPAAMDFEDTEQAAR